MSFRSVLARTKYINKLEGKRTSLKEDNRIGSKQKKISSFSSILFFRDELINYNDDDVGSGGEG